MMGIKRRWMHGVLAGGLVAATVSPAVAAAESRPTTTSAPAANPLVAGMKANTWLKLPTPTIHPMSRSSSPWMPYVPEAGCAILWGCSHSGYHNDVWTFRLSDDRWIENLKTEPSAAQDPDVLTYKDGCLMTRLERPLSFHQWGLMDYDPDQRVLWHLGGQWQGVYNLTEFYQKLGRPIHQEGDPSKQTELLKKGPMLWQYSLTTNRWSRVYTEDPTGCTRHRGYIRYFPPLKRLIMTPCVVSPNEEREKFKMYDPATNKWEPLNVTWEPMDEGVSKYWEYGYSPIVYDAKRKALVLNLNGGGTWLLDPVARTVKQVVGKAKTPPGNLDGPSGAFGYDATNSTVLAIFADLKTYDSGVNLQKRGFPSDRALVLALDVDKKEWTVQPPPADGVMPPVDRSFVFHHFYDPVNNVTIVYRGPYNGEATETWAYRYKP